MILAKMCALYRAINDTGRKIPLKAFISVFSNKVTYLTAYQLIYQYEDLSKSEDGYTRCAEKLRIRESNGNIHFESNPFLQNGKWKIAKAKGHISIGTIWNSSLSLDKKES